MRDARRDISDERRDVRRVQRGNKIEKKDERRMKRKETYVTREQRMSGERRERRDRRRDEIAEGSVTCGHTRVNFVESKRCAVPGKGTPDVYSR